MILLAILRVGEHAYGVPIAREIESTGRRSVILGAVYAALERLERNGLVSSRMGNPEPRTWGPRQAVFRRHAPGTESRQRDATVAGRAMERRRSTEGRDGMTRLDPPTLANVLLHRLALDNEPLAGDLVEEFQSPPVTALAVATIDRRARDAGALRTAPSRVTEPDAGRPGRRGMADVEEARQEEDGEPHRHRRRGHWRADDGDPWLHDVDGDSRDLVVCGSEESSQASHLVSSS